MRKVIAEYRRHNGGAEYTVGGRGILRRKLSTEERVELATDVALGLVTVTPSITQAAALVGAPLHRVEEEIKRADAEYRAKAEARAAVQEEAEAVHAEADRIVAAWDLASPAGRDAAVRMLSPSAMWDVIAPIVT
jgi:hypothetical protein